MLGPAQPRSGKDLAQVPRISVCRARHGGAQDCAILCAWPCRSGARPLAYEAERGRIAAEGSAPWWGTAIVRHDTRRGGVDEPLLGHHVSLRSNSFAGNLEPTKLGSPSHEASRGAREHMVTESPNASTRWPQVPRRSRNGQERAGVRARNEFPVKHVRPAFGRKHAHIWRHEVGRDGPERVVGVGRGAEAAEEPRALQVRQSRKLTG